MSQTIMVKPDDIREGDVFANPGHGGTGWTALEDAELLSSGEVSVQVQYDDGGIGERIFGPPRKELPVTRP
jgi:hypothetical protein